MKKDKIIIEKVEYKEQWMPINTKSIHTITSCKLRNRCDLLSVYTALTYMAFKKIEVDSVIGFLNSMLCRKHVSIGRDIRQLHAMKLIKVARRGEGRLWKAFKKIIIV